MFGLEGEKAGKKVEEFTFDIEKDIKDASKQRGYLEKIQGRLQSLKTILKAGVEKEEIQSIGVLLHGYSSLFKIFSRKPKVKFK